MSGDRRNVWSEAMDTALARMWTEGHTGAVIASHFRTTRNAVIGRAHRLHLPPRPSPIAGYVPKPPAPRPQRAVQPVIIARDVGIDVPPVVVVPPPPPPPPPVRLCQWIEGDDPRAWVVCGRPAYRRSAYCGPHFQRCYQHRSASWRSEAA